MYINDLPLRMNSLSELILADGTNVIICSKKLDDFCSVKLISVSKSKWFAGNNWSSI